MNRDYLVRHGLMRLYGGFSALPDVDIPRGDKVIVKSDRGLEIGYVVRDMTPEIARSIPDLTGGSIVRKMTPEDLKREHQLEEERLRLIARAERLVAEARVAMKIIDVERLFGAERVILYFVAEGRVDFRELVKNAAREYQSRIELRQIGVRDEAKVLADFGDCGRPVCCNTHMIVMPPVSMRMAKLQKSTLDPTKISGRCGRLKCCLRFEQDIYEENQADLPEPGTRVVTSKGQGRVIAQEILARRVLIEFEDGRRLPIPAAEILSRL